jgi:undecaprenyl-diphosphatase
MNTNIEAILLGIVQGLTEFLPVSSSGHLEIAQYFLGDKKDLNSGLLMTVTLHAATALATVFVFRKEIGIILSGLLKPKINESHLFSRNIILSMIPAVFVGLFWEDEIDQLFEGQIVLVSCLLLVTAGILFWADKAKPGTKAVGPKEAILIGIAQMIAILPGVSRSGATISASVLLGIQRTEAARFSFLMVIPLILGKMSKDLIDGAFNVKEFSLLPLALGFIAAFFTGLFACNLMIKVVQRSKLGYFALYCFIVGTGMLLYLAAN